MKLLIITAIDGFKKEIKETLKKSGVTAFSYQKITGYKNMSITSLESNWFASDAGENQSLMFYAFTPEEYVDQVFESIESFNASLKTTSKIHVALVNIDRIN
ncbi:hypothetical protein R9C00_09800 [Flammeovirgaceae bacterium SG7u.111]|nr:hypothetical protein [Flammeovirgaceae bacterium SG7u.132]WPO37744.1 hypothetical protein R9C00_09800 [Flammeovirgaceae bacterium SG7u.111]